MKEKRIVDILGLVEETYIAEAAPQKRQMRPGFRLRKLALCAGAVILAICLSFGTVLAVNAQWRQAVIAFFFPLYTENEICEIEEGHRSGSFDMIDTLNTFLEQFNRENMIEGLTAKKDGGFHYTLIPKDEIAVNVIVECSPSSEKLLVMMERKPYEETTGLWQVTAYQVIDSQTAEEMMEDFQ